MSVSASSSVAVLSPPPDKGGIFFPRGRARRSRSNGSIIGVRESIRQTAHAAYLVAHNAKEALLHGGQNPRPSPTSISGFYADIPKSEGYDEASTYPRTYPIVNPRASALSPSSPSTIPRAVRRPLLPKSITELSLSNIRRGNKSSPVDLVTPNLESSATAPPLPSTPHVQFAAPVAVERDSDVEEPATSEPIPRSPSPAPLRPLPVGLKSRIARVQSRFSEFANDFLAASSSSSKSPSSSRRQSPRFSHLRTVAILCFGFLTLVWLVISAVNVHRVVAVGRRIDMAVSGLQQVAYAAVVAPPASPRSSVDEERSRVLESTYARLTSVHETLRAAQRRMGSLQGFIEDVDDRVRDALVALDSVGGDDVGRETRLGRAIDLLEGLVGTIAEEVGQRPSHDTHDTS